jgi:DNA-binding MarR family transcriptional regulator
VALTRKGRNTITPVFRAHAGVMERVFAELSPAELRQFEDFLKRVGKRAESLHAGKGRASRGDKRTSDAD